MFVCRFSDASVSNGQRKMSSVASMMQMRFLIVLKFLGGDALKEVIEKAELYQLQVPDRAMLFMNFFLNQ
ncbi:hypothetical protein Patl1_11529 [Pistacia atlantica]|uniref:Uncharacterized protein n=1 Tax=Pistacia atlantica TaxID=434234 RepID=A0ACC1A2P7_9ROSI|nr:hypothetical protein Patl1_11529 [Pistacia atlantica]